MKKIKILLFVIACLSGGAAGAQQMLDGPFTIKAWGGIASKDSDIIGWHVSLGGEYKIGRWGLDVDLARSINDSPTLQAVDYSVAPSVRHYVDRKQHFFLTTGGNLQWGDIALSADVARGQRYWLGYLFAGLGAKINFLPLDRKVNFGFELSATLPLLFFGNFDSWTLNLQFRSMQLNSGFFINF